MNPVPRGRRVKYLLALVPQLAFLLYMIAAAERTLVLGTPVELAIQPFDPIDPLSGRHLVVPLAIERVDPGSALVMGEPLEVGQTVFVLLDRTERPTEVISIQTYPPQAGVLHLRAVVRDAGPPIVLDYGLERFFIPLDATDPSLHRDADGRRPELRLLVRIDGEGRGVTEDLLVDGESFADWNRSIAK
jgi:uncharacterized membrane-anchored protein